MWRITTRHATSHPWMLNYKTKGRGLDSWCCHWHFSIIGIIVKGNLFNVKYWFSNREFIGYVTIILPLQETMNLISVFVIHTVLCNNSRMELKGGLKFWENRPTHILHNFHYFSSKYRYITLLNKPISYHRYVPQTNRLYFKNQNSLHVWQ